MKYKHILLHILEEKNFSVGAHCPKHGFLFLFTKALFHFTPFLNFFYTNTDTNVKNRKKNVRIMLNRCIPYLVYFFSCVKLSVLLIISSCVSKKPLSTGTLTFRFQCIVVRMKTTFDCLSAYEYSDGNINVHLTLNSGTMAFTSELVSLPLCFHDSNWDYGEGESDEKREEKRLPVST